MAKKNKVVKPNREYELPDSSGLKDGTVRVLAADPGIRNFGLSVVACRGSQVRVMANTVLTNPMNDMTKFQVQRKVFIEELRRWVELYKPNAFIAERFMLRGAGTGMAMGELVPSMVALAAGVFDLNTLTIGAATWKVPLQNRFDFDLKQLYKEASVEPHQLDSAFIGIYGLEKGLRTELKFTPERVMVQVEDSSLLPLKNRRR
jgi:hypothetical protein